MRPQADRKKGKFHIGKGLRLQIYAWCTVVGVVMFLGTGITHAWYSMQKREAETKAPNVMKPYHLNLSNPSETGVLQLSVGSLLQGKTKQIIFCVNTEEESRINKDETTFDYTLELVHTDNLALKYELYALDSVAEADKEALENRGTEVLTAEDTVELDGTPTMHTTYWTKKTKTVANGTQQAVPLTGREVSALRQEQVGLTGADAESGTKADEEIINRGTYISFDTSENSDESNDLKLTVGGEADGISQGIRSRYYVLEISWDDLPEGSNYNAYNKETEMIYIVAKAIQPEPTRK